MPHHVFKELILSLLIVFGPILQLDKTNYRQVGNLLNYLFNTLLNYLFNTLLNYFQGLWKKEWLFLTDLFGIILKHNIRCNNYLYKIYNIVFWILYSFDIRFKLFIRSLKNIEILIVSCSRSQALTLIPTLCDLSRACFPFNYGLLLYDFVE